MATAPPVNGGMGFCSASAAAPVSTIELSVSCRNLRDADVFSKSDPMCVLFAQEFGTQKFVEVARTEVIMNNLNPDFARKFVISYYFEECQKLRFEVYDIDSDSPVLAHHDFLGRVDCTLGEIVSSCSVTKPLVIRRKKFRSRRHTNMQYGTITVTAEELAACKEEVTLQFMAQKLDKKTYFLFWGSSSPFLSLSKANENGTFTVVHRTEFLQTNLSPTWKPFTLSVQALCNGDYERVIKMECYDYQSNGSHKFIGEVFSTLRQLKEGRVPSNVYELMNYEKQKRKGNTYKNSGELHLLSAQVNPLFTFLDYVLGGRTELLCTIAIDFTSSNGDPRSPTSLHYIDPYKPNHYLQALRSVGEIIQDYDSDKMFPVLGFGARLPPEGRVSHEFFVNLDHSNPYCSGLEGIITAYHNCIYQVQLYGPTNFSPVINHVARFATATRDGSKYHILLIITDGIITDMPQTKEAIVNASCLPLSIIIVGVGQADFAAMEELDGDVVRLSSKGRYAERDIVQFVPFREFQAGLQGGDHVMTQARLAKAVLAEIPIQFLSYMKNNGIKPGAPKNNIGHMPPDPMVR